MNISFAWTTEAYKCGVKTETRRFWKPKYAAMWKPNTFHTALSKDFRYAGKRIGRFYLPNLPYLEELKDMSEKSFIAEGGTMYWKNRKDYIECMGGPDLIPFVLKFEPIGCPKCRWCGFKIEKDNPIITCEKCVEKWNQEEREEDLLILKKQKVNT